MLWIDQSVENKADALERFEIPRILAPLIIVKIPSLGPLKLHDML